PDASPTLLLSTWPTAIALPKLWSFSNSTFCIFFFFLLPEEQLPSRRSIARLSVTKLNSFAKAESLLLKTNFIKCPKLNFTVRYDKILGQILKYLNSNYENLCKK